MTRFTDRELRLREAKCLAQGHTARNCSQADGLTDNVLPPRAWVAHEVSREQPWEDENGSGRESPLCPPTPHPPQLPADMAHGPPHPTSSMLQRPRCQLDRPSCPHRDSVKGLQATEKGLTQQDGASHIHTGLGILGSPTSPQGIQSLQLLLRLLATQPARTPS